jgi:glycerate 2-kinase
MALEGIANAAILSSGTDGTDGPTDAAGAFADGSTIARARAAGIDPARSLVNNDSHNFFAALGDLHITGPTGTNVMDLVIGVVD